MKPNKETNLLKRITLCAAAAAFVLRFSHYSLGTDGRGLLVRNHWAVYGLWILCIAFAAAALILGGNITGSRRSDGAQPASPMGAAGSFALGAVLLMTILRNFDTTGLPADLLIRVLGLCAGIGMMIVGICRLTGKKPYFLMHAALCLYVSLRMVSMYRQCSSEPQLQDYGFLILAHAAMMLCAYQHAAFDAGLGNHKSLWLSSLGTVFLSCAALPRCEEWILVGAFALWAFTNLTVLPVRKRRTRPALNPEESGEEAT